MKYEMRYIRQLLLSLRFTGPGQFVSSPRTALAIRINGRKNTELRRAVPDGTELQIEETNHVTETTRLVSSLGRQLGALVVPVFMACIPKVTVKTA